MRTSPRLALLRRQRGVMRRLLGGELDQWRKVIEYRNRTDEILDAVIEGEETVVVTLADGRKLVLVPGSE
jgi:hypothetical protein